MKKILTILAIAALSFASCTKNGTTPTEDKITIANANEWDASNAASSNGGEFRLNINATTNWTAETDAEWLLIDPAKGSKGDNVITLATFPNTNPEILTATVTIKAGTATETLTLTQEAASGKHPNGYEQQSYNVAKDGGELEIIFYSDAGYDESHYPEYLPEPVDWLTLKNIDKSVEGEYKLIFTVKANSTGAERNVGVQSCAGASCFFTSVTQAA